MIFNIAKILMLIVFINKSLEDEGREILFKINKNRLKMSTAIFT